MKTSFRWQRNFLRERGIDAVSVHDVSALGLTDHEQLRRATEDARTLVTFNYHDFNALAAHCFEHGIAHAGIIISYRQYSREQITELVRQLAELATTTDADRMRNSLAVLPAG